ncbi:carbohydrate ABC transporter permease [Clostridium pasteurianum]|uniref:Permease component of ABC-type sugar transporter n=1 Tax=Clostridium pasteurianum BC1 TaxID=86416 RepID=R4K7E1_CLOPA|nr:sugar ABC transporter permease [Clostridium pasteurianum]AGK98483.1 permease component of ABC-type sugar transporter [Clostridium pasteurianum BC1]
MRNEKLLDKKLLIFDSEVKYKKKYKKAQTKDAIAFILPHFIGFTVFILLSIISTFVISFYKWDLLTPAKFVGLQNYIDIFTNDILATKVFQNTLYYTVVSVILIDVLSLLIALGLNQKIKGIKILRAIYFLPTVASLVGVSLVWIYIYNTNYGLLNFSLRKVGISNVPAWLSDKNWSMIAVIIMSVWGQIGTFVIIYLGGLKNIPENLYEAAEIDGVTKWGKFKNITVPLLSPTTFFVVVMTVINSFQVFEQAYILTNGGPNFSTTTMVLYLYNTGFQSHKMGYACALGWILFLCIFIITLFQNKFQKKWVNYD